MGAIALRRGFFELKLTSCFARLVTKHHFHDQIFVLKQKRWEIHRRVRFQNQFSCTNCHPPYCFKLVRNEQPLEAPGIREPRSVRAFHCVPEKSIVGTQTVLAVPEVDTELVHKS